MPIQNSTELFDFADQLALVSSEVLRFRINNRSTLLPDQKTHLEDIEIALDHATASVRAKGIAALGAELEPHRLAIMDATKKAGEFLQRIATFVHALNVATSILNLATVVLTGNPMGIISALRDINSKLTDGES